MESNPIYVDAKPTKEQFAVAFRYMLMGASAFATGMGYNATSENIDAFAQYAGPIGASLAFLWGQVCTVRGAHIKAKLAAVVPDEIATLK